MQKGARIALVGKGEAAMAVAAALGRVAGVQQVRQVAALPKPLLGVDLVVEMVGGVEAAFQVAMGALGQGVGVVATSPMLLAAHGRVLACAAFGQHAFFGYSAVGLGVPVDDLLAGRAVTRMGMVMGEGANAILARMAFRDESLSRVEADMARQEMDLSDISGKVTQARGLALLGAWAGVWPKASGQLRVGLEGVDVADVKKMRTFGLRLVYGARVTREGVYAGPMAVAADSPLATAQGRDVLLAEHEDGESVWSQAMNDEARVRCGVAGDVRRALRQRVARAGVEEGQGIAETGRCYVRVPYARREALMAVCARVAEERTEGDGNWQAVLEGVDVRQARMLAPEGAVWPLTGAWESQSAGLRLVG